MEAKGISEALGVAALADEVEDNPEPCIDSITVIILFCGVEEATKNMEGEKYI